MGSPRRFDLLFTSLPYYNLINYHYDQWLPIWLLGGPAHPCSGEGPWRGRFSSAADYRSLLNKVFKDCAALMTPDAIAYVRTDARPLTLTSTVAALEQAFPGRRVTLLDRPFSKDTRTALYGDRSKKPGEVDIVVCR